MNSKKVAIIPARGGSKRLPRKNILPVLGRPVITYPLQTAIDSKIFNQVIVSSEDDEICNIASEYDCRVMKRPEKLATDTSNLVQVCSHILETLSEENLPCDFFCLIYATAIFIKTEDIKNSYKLFSQEPFPDVIMGVSEFNLQPMQALYKDIDGFMKPQWPEHNRKQSQKYPDYVASNGTIYWSKTDIFKQQKNFYVKKLKEYQIPKYRAIDIDTKEDYTFVKKMATLFL